MKVDAGLGLDLTKIPQQIRELEAAGYDRAATAEMAHDPFFPLVLAAEHSEKIELATSIAVGFARSPMILANIGNDLQAYSKGRLTIGLGSQIQPHIEKRFSMPWGAPAAKMREMVLSMRAIWANWYDGTPLQFVGKFYRHTLMTPAFTPKNNPYGAPKVILAAVGPHMTEVAGEVADGMIIHPFSNMPFIKEVTLPALERGMQKSGRTRENFELSYSNFVVSGRNEQEFEAAKKATKERIAFYGSTPAYKGVLDAIGVGDLQGELNKMSKQGRWAEMGTIISDEVLNEFAVVGEPKDIAPEILRRYGSFIDRTSGGFTFVDEDQRKAMIAQLRAG